MIMIGSVYPIGESSGIEIGPGPKTLDVGEGYNYNMIQSAVDDASPGDTIAIHSGTYNEYLVINKSSITIKGIGNPTLIRTSSPNGTVIFVMGDDFYLSGINTTGFDLLILSNRCRLERMNVSRLRVSGESLYLDHINAAWLGISAKPSVNGYNYVTNCSGSFSIDYSSDLIIENCIAIDSEGFRVDTSKNIVFRECIAYKTSCGFEIYRSDGSIMDSFSFENKYNGIFVDGQIDNYFTISSSFIFDNTENGIEIGNIGPINIFDNILLNNGANGLKFFANSQPRSETRPIYIKNNLIMSNSDYGICIPENLGAYMIYGNDFINNNLLDNQVYSDSPSIWFDNVSKKGNHWSEWTNPDNDSNGIVDLPYDISGDNDDQDLYPQTKRLTNLSTPPKPDLSLIEGVGPQILWFDLDATWGQSYRVTLRLYDPDTPADELVLSMQTSANWLKLNGNILYGTPPMGEGIYNITLTLSDGLNKFYRECVITVPLDLHPDWNDLPILVTNDIPMRVNVGSLYHVEFRAVDYEKDNLTWNLRTNAPFLDISGRILSGIPREYNVGTYGINISVGDGSGLWTYYAYDLVVFIVPLRIVTSSGVNGAYVFSVEDLTGGNITIVQIEWYVDGVFKGNGTELNINLEGEHTILLKVKDSLGNEYAIEKNVGHENMDNTPIDLLWPLVISALLFLIVIVILGSFVLKAKQQKKAGSDRVTASGHDKLIADYPKPGKEGSIPSDHVIIDGDPSVDRVFNSLRDEAYLSITKKREGLDRSME
jgi:nitrous oxidase accessory protein NosD